MSEQLPNIDEQEPSDIPTIRIENIDNQEKGTDDFEHRLSIIRKLDSIHLAEREDSIRELVDAIIAKTYQGLEIEKFLLYENLEGDKTLKKRFQTGCQEVIGRLLPHGSIEAFIQSDNKDIPEILLNLTINGLSDSQVALAVDLAKIRPLDPKLKEKYEEEIERLKAYYLSSTETKNFLGETLSTSEEIIKSQQHSQIPQGFWGSFSSLLKNLLTLFKSKDNQKETTATRPINTILQKLPETKNRKTWQDFRKAWENDPTEMYDGFGKELFFSSENQTALKQNFWARIEKMRSNRGGQHRAEGTLRRFYPALFSGTIVTSVMKYPEVYNQILTKDIEPDKVFDAVRIYLINKIPLEITTRAKAGKLSTQKQFNELCDVHFKLLSENEINTLIRKLT